MLFYEDYKYIYMTTKLSSADIISNAFVGKKFISSEINNKPECLLIDVNDNETGVRVKEIVGKTIKYAELTCYSYRDNGIKLMIEGYDDWFFFFDSDAITIDDKL